MDCGIYCLTCKPTSKKYIGQSVSISQRKWHHLHQLKKGKHYNQHLQRAYNKHGEDAFVFRVLVECHRDDLDAAELFFIRMFDTTNRYNGYNLKAGGNSSAVASETKEKIRQALIGHEVSEESRAKIAESGMGRVQSPETREKIRAAMKQRVFTEEHRRKISEAKKGVPKSEEHKRKLSEYYRKLREAKEKQRDLPL